MTQSKCLMSTNVYSCYGKIVISGACLEQVYPEAFEEITKDSDQVYTLCLEETHINMAVTKISAILGTKQVSGIDFASVDRSPHCTQMHYIKHEIERTMPEHPPIKDFVVVDNKIVEVSDEAIDLSKSLSKLSIK